MNKKGLTLVELVSCISIISIVIILLFQLVITMQNSQNSKEDINKTNLTIAMIAREVQKDMESFGLADTPTTNCNLSAYGDDRNQILPTNVLNSINPYYCIKIVYNQDDVKNNEAYILYYQNKGKGFLAYKRGKGNVMEMQVVREISKLPSANRDVVISKVVNSSNISSLKMDLPIGNSSDDYNLSIRYIDNNDLVDSNEHFVSISGSDGVTNIKGSGKYQEGDIVNVSFDYDSNAYTLESVGCSSTISCSASTSFSFTMPSSNVIINIVLKAKETVVSNKLIDYIKELDRTENGLIEDSYGNLRYVDGPNNYIDFNGETWRIIGVFDEGVKIIKEESIGEYAWDTSSINNWSTSSLKTYLNEDYYNSLTTTAKNQIAEVTWYLGGASATAVSASNMYDYERGAKVYTGDDITRDTTWTGKIALMYPSDWGYASNVSACKTNLYKCNDSGAQTNNWLFTSQKSGSIESNYYEWFLTPISAYSNFAIIASKTGEVFYGGDVSDASDIRPTLYLKSDVIRTGGYGTSGSHFQISI